jgi:hypothetical protein
MVVFMLVVVMVMLVVVIMFVLVLMSLMNFSHKTSTSHCVMKRTVANWSKRVNHTQ